MAETCINCNHDCHCADNGICTCNVGVGMSDKSQTCECVDCKCGSSSVHRVTYPDWG
jgi:hypothetical protein